MLTSYSGIKMHWFISNKPFPNIIKSPEWRPMMFFKTREPQTSSRKLRHARRHIEAELTALGPTRFDQ